MAKKSTRRKGDTKCDSNEEALSEPGLIRPLLSDFNLAF